MTKKKRHSNGAHETAQQVKAMAAKSDDLSFIPKTHKLEKENHSYI